MMSSLKFSATGAEIWLLIYFDISCIIFNRRFRIGIKNARWYIGTTGGNYEALASFIRFMIRPANEHHRAARQNVLVDLTGYGRFPWNQTRQAVVV
jgi:hypothetical protein